MQRDTPARLEACVSRGGVVLFGVDTVYGLGCDPEQGAAVARLYAIKGRPRERSAAVMFLSLAAAAVVLDDLTDAERAASLALLPGPVTLLLPNRRRRFPLACGSAPQTLGLRVPRLGPGQRVLATVARPLLQSSANRSGAADTGRLEEVEAGVREGVDLVLDAGRLGGRASTVVDLRELAIDGGWRVLRVGAMPADAVTAALADHRSSS